MKLKHYHKNPRYLVSDLGHVFGPGSGHSYEGSAPIYFAIEPRIEKKTGYLKVSVHYPDGQKGDFLHRMVLETFYGPPINQQQASHLNGIKTDCRLENLKWESPKENCSRKYEHGTAFNAAKVQRKIKDHQIETVFKCFHQGMTYQDISRRFNVSGATVSKLIRGIRNKQATARFRGNTPIGLCPSVEQRSSHELIGATKDSPC